MNGQVEILGARPALRWVDPGYLHAVVAGDDVAMLELLALFDRTCDAQCGRLAHAAATRSPAEAGAAAHALRGSLGVIGAQATSAMLDAIEDACARGWNDGIGGMLEAVLEQMREVRAEVETLRPRHCARASGI